MRSIIGRNSSEQDPALQGSSHDFVLQVGNMKVPLKAEKLLGGSVRVSQKSQLPLKAEKILGPPVLNEEDKAIEAFSRMQEAFSSPTQPQHTGNWVPFSPDDMYPHDSQADPCLPPPASRQRPAAPYREPSDANLPGYYDPASASRQPGQAPPQTPASVARASAEQQRPTIFDNLSGPALPSNDLLKPSMEQLQVSPHSKTNRRVSKPRKLDLVQLLPHSRPSTGRVAPSSDLSSSPTAQARRADSTLPPLPPKASGRKSRGSAAVGKGSAATSRPATSGIVRVHTINENTFDPHKTHVRRPPKGIQNWFDAYPDSDIDGEVEDDDEDDDEEEFQQVSPPVIPQPEPQELPADELPPAYSAPSRQISRASEKSGSHARSSDPALHMQHPAERTAVQEETDRYRSEGESHSWDSIQSSHIGRIAPESGNGQVGTTNTAGRSVLSLSELEYLGEDEVEALPTFNDSARDERVMTLGSVMSMDVPSPAGQTRNGLHPRASRNASHQTTEQVTLRLLNDNTVEVSPGNGDVARRESEGSPPDATHIIAVTEEERMLLDHMRRRQMEMQHVSFTEGYQMALQAEQQRLAQHAAGGENSTSNTLHLQEMERLVSRTGSLPTPVDDNDMRRQLSAIRKEHVDQRFQLERFFAASQPQDGPVELPTRRFSGELLPATVYSPAGTPSNRSPAYNNGAFPDEDADAESVKKRVQHFIATKGAVPPLTTPLKTMQRPSKTRLASGSKPPSSIAEESDPPPAIPKRSPERQYTHDKPESTSKVSLVSFDCERHGDSPVSAFPTFTEAIRIHHQNESAPELSPRSDESRKGITSHPNTSSPSLSQSFSPVSPFSNLINKAASKPRPVQDGTYTPDTDLSRSTTDSDLPSGVKKIPVPRSRFSPATSDHSGDSMISNSSAGEDVLAAWQQLGGASQGLNIKRKT